MSSSRTREQHTGEEAIVYNRRIMHRHRLNKEEMERECNILQAWELKHLKPLEDNEKIAI